MLLTGSAGCPYMADPMHPKTLGLDLLVLPDTMMSHRDVGRGVHRCSPGGRSQDTSATWLHERLQAG